MYGLYILDNTPMQKTISLLIVAAITLSSSPVSARVLGKAMVAAPLSAPTAIGLPAGLNAVAPGMSLSINAPTLGTNLLMIDSPVLPQSAKTASVAATVAAPSSVQAAPIARKTVSLQPGVQKPVSVKTSLETAVAEIAPAAKKEGGAAVARDLSSRFFDSASLNAADQGDGVSGDAAPKARRTKGLQASPKERTFAQKATVPALSVVGVAAAAAVIADPALPAKAAAWLMQLPAVETVLNVFMMFPTWAQTGVWVGAGFGVASIAPKIVRPVVKAVFQQLEWNKLREDWLTNVITYASWFGAATYAVGMVGGWEALVVNSSLFAITTTFAVKDVAANVADGFFLYQNRTLEIGEPFEALGYEGVLDGANPRFVIIDTSADKEFGFDRVLIPNQKLDDAGIGGVAKEGEASARRFGGAAAISLASIGAAWAALGPVGQSVAIGVSMLWLGKRLNTWVKSQEAKAESFRKSNVEQYRKHRFRSRVLWWFRNGVYMTGLGLIMHLFGVPVTGMITGLGIFAAAAGFYMKSVSQNLVGGLMIAAYLPFSAGDYIQVGKYEGVVAGMTQSELRLWTDEAWTDGNRGYVDVPLTYVMKEVIKIRTQSSAADITGPGLPKAAY